MDRNVVEIFQSRLEDLILNEQEKLQSESGKKVSVEKIAKMIGVAPSSISKYRNPGKNTEAQSGNLKKIAEYFNVSTDFLLGLTDTPTLKADIRMISDYTGLSERVISRLQWYRRLKLDGTEIPIAIDDMLWELISSSSNACITLCGPIMKKATRLAVEDIAKELIIDPQRFTPSNKEAKETLREIEEHATHVHNIAPERASKQSIIEGKCIDEFWISNIMDILKRYLPDQGDPEFDRFESTQQYIKAFNLVMEKYPDTHLIEQQKSVLLVNIGLQFDKDEMNSGE